MNEQKQIILDSDEEATEFAEWSNHHGGPYHALVVALRYAAKEGALDGSSGLGTEGQDLILLTAARLAVRDPNGCRQRLAYLLDAVSDIRREVYRPVLCAMTPSSGLHRVRERYTGWETMQRETAAQLARGEGRT